jgi:hypothetical protein
MYHRIPHRSDHHVTSDHEDKSLFSNLCRIDLESSPSVFNQAVDLLAAFGGRRLLVRRCPIEKVLEYEIFLPLGRMVLRFGVASREMSIGYRMV